MLESCPEGTLVSVWVVAGANRSEVVGVYGDAVKVRVSAAAEGGKANEAMLRLLSDLTGARCEVRRGTGSRRKAVLVAGRGTREVTAALGIERPRRQRRDDESETRRIDGPEAP